MPHEFSRFSVDTDGSGLTRRRPQFVARTPVVNEALWGNGAGIDLVSSTVPCVDFDAFSFEQGDGNIGEIAWLNLPFPHGQ